MRRFFRIATAVAGLALWSLTGTAKGPDDKPGQGPRPHPSHARPAGSQLPHPHGGPPPGDRSARGDARREEMRARTEELRRTRLERRRQHVEAARRRYPPEVLADARVRDEFRIHARRMARLHRAELVAKTELDEPKRGEVLARVKRLMEREEARHDKRVTRLRSGPGPAASAPSLPTPKGSAP